MTQVYVERRRLVARVLGERPLCERCHFAVSTEIHEVKSRARGGSILDEANCRALCHVCHQFITEHPRQAEAEGFSVASWSA
jgi:hypothetical protein